jgi:hypothetical protein
MLDQTMSLEVPEKAHQQRLKICDECPLLLREGTSIKTSRCGDCGCYVYIKSGLKDFTCPQGKW